MSAGLKSRFRAGAKVCSGAILVLLVIAALGPEKWTPRTPLGWRFDHFIGYFTITLLVCFAWPRPLVVGVLMIAAAFLLEGLQLLHRIGMPILWPHYAASGGVLAAALLAELFIQGSRWHLKGAQSTKLNASVRETGR